MAIECTIIYLKKFVKSQKLKVKFIFLSDNTAHNFEINLQDEILFEMTVIANGKYIWVPPENRIKIDQSQSRVVINIIFIFFRKELKQLNLIIVIQEKVSKISM